MFLEIHTKRKPPVSRPAETASRESGLAAGRQAGVSLAPGTGLHHGTSSVVPSRTALAFFSSRQKAFIDRGCLTPKEQQDHVSQQRKRSAEERAATVKARKPRRLQPTLLALEDRKLLSTIVVNNPTDTPVIGLIDLRQAIVQANTNGGVETITFDKTVFKTPQTISLTGGQLELSDTTGTETITGPKVGVTVSGGGLSRVFEVEAGVTASISGMTITGGSAPGVGVLQRRRPGQLRRHNHADQLHRQRQLRRRVGGGLFTNSAGTTTLTNCTVSGNSAAGAAAWHQLRRHDDADQLHRQRQLRRQSGGGLINYFGGTMTLTNCTVSGNSAADGAAVACTTMARPR